VRFEKWGLDVESTYRRAGLTEAATAVRDCRELGACAKVLTESEAYTAYRTGRITAGLGDPGATAVAGMVAPGLAPEAAPALGGAAETAVARAAARWGTAAVLEGGAAAEAAPAAVAAAEVAPAAAGVATVAVPIAVGVYVVIAVVDLLLYASFQRKLRQLGYVILPSPLGVCIGLCHQPAAPTFPQRLPPAGPTPAFPRRLSDEELRSIGKWLEPSPTPTPIPLPVPEEEPRRRCTVEEVEPKFGRYPCHSDFAKTFSGTRREFRVTDPKGIYVDFDAKRGEILYEVKTGYGWMLNPNLGPIWQERRRQVIENFHEQAWWQMAIAAECGYYLDWYFNSKTVAEYFNSLLEPPVKWKAFDCDRDSDHMW